MAFKFRDLKVNEEILAVYTAQYPNVGAFKKIAHEFMIMGEGKKCHIWGSAVLNHILYGIRFGTLVKLRYLGKKPSDRNNGRELHQWELEVIEPDAIMPKKKKKVNA